MLHGLVQQLVLGQEIRELPQLGVVRQLAHDDQVGNLDEGGLLSKLLDRDAAVAQDSLLAVNEGDLAFARAGVSVPVIEGDVSRLVAQRGNINRPLLLGAFDNGKFVGLSV